MLPALFLVLDMNYLLFRYITLNVVICQSLQVFSSLIFLIYFLFIYFFKMNGNICDKMVCDCLLKLPLTQNQY